MESAPNSGVMLSDPREAFYFDMVKFLKKGISPAEFRRCRRSDIEICVAIDDAGTTKAGLNAEAQKLMDGMR